MDLRGGMSGARGGASAMVALLLASCGAATVEIDGPDAASSSPDAEVPADASLRPDAARADASGSPDAGTPADASSGADAGPGPVCAPDLSRTYAAAPDLTFRAGPYLQYTTATSVVVMWESAAASDSVVQYGPGGLLTSTANGPAAAIHEVRLTGLDPEALYAYRVGDGTTWSGPLTFRTAPAAEAAFRFVATGDSQGGPAAGLVDRMLEFKPSLLVHAGDVVSSGSWQDQWRTQLLGGFRRLAHHVPVFVAPGNHDTEYGATTEWFRAYLAYPFPEGDPEHELFYDLRWGAVYFLFLRLDETTPTQAQVDWIDARLASAEARSAKWRVAVYHTPAYSQGWAPCRGWTGSGWVQTNLLWRLEAAGVQLIFNGHTHDYERGLLRGVYHVTTGGGGGVLDNVPDCDLSYDHIQVEESSFHFMAVEVGCEQMTVRAVRVDGSEIDSFVIPAAR